MKKKFAFIILNLLFAFTCTVSAYGEYVIPSGQSCGIRLFTDGLSVIAVQEVTDISGNSVSPGRDSGIKSGDVILSAADIPLSTIEDLSEAVNKNPDGLNLEIRRNCEALSISIKPAKISEDTSKLGLWVRDSAAGIGTLTCYIPDRNSFAALGHGICDVDTGNILSVNSGNIQLCTQIRATKSEKGVPGELEGSFDGKIIGEIGLNCSAGVFGTLNDRFIPQGELMRTAQRNEVQKGAAYIMTDALGEGVQCHSIEITKVKENGTDTKSIIFRITDERLIEKTGGIVRGMSGSPIIQNNMLAGAVTHVFVNDPAKGYGILMESMLDGGSI